MNDCQGLCICVAFQQVWAIASEVKQSRCAIFAYFFAVICILYCYVPLCFFSLLNLHNPPYNIAMKLQSALFPGPKDRKAVLVIDIILKEFCDYFQRKDTIIYLNLYEFGNVKALCS